jgi:ribosome-associated heat shock protein Hsp15
MRAKADAEAAARRVRFDKWLWAARFFRTRSLAAQAIDAGQARIEGERAKPAHIVKPGQRVALRRGGLAWSIVVIAVSERRGAATDAAKLYAEAPESAAAREHEIARRRAAAAIAPDWGGRPSKRDRRKLQEFLDEA